MNQNAIGNFSCVKGGKCTYNIMTSFTGLMGTNTTSSYMK